MKKTLTLILSIILLGANAQTCTKIVGTVGTGNYEQLILSSYSANAGNPEWSEILSFAWTCNAIGYPVCNYRTLLKFNLNSIPANAIITSAVLNLYSKSTGQLNGSIGQPMSGSANASYLQKVTSAWNNPNTGWNNQPSVDVPTQKTLAQSTSSNQNYSTDIKDFVQTWVSDPSSNNGMLLRLQNEQYYNSLIFHSGLSTIPEGVRPSLEICYTTPPTSCTNFTIQGTVGSDNYQQLVLATYSPNGGNNVWDELLAFSWTCDAIGYSTCDYRTLMKYDLQAIPSTATISSAKLKLFAKTTGQKNGYIGQPMYGSNNAGFLQKVTSSWNNPNTGWNNQPTVETSSQKTLEQSTVSTGQDYEVDVTDFVKSWVSDASSNNGVLLRLQAENYYNSLIFHSGISSIDAALRPTLSICYSDISLPLVLKDFTGSLAKNVVNLEWASENERNLSHFELEKSTDGVKFELLKNVVASNTPNSNAYTFSDPELSTPKVFYRLKMIDKDGRITYSNVISFQISGSSLKKLTVLPNPAKSYVNVRFNSGLDGLRKIAITDVSGRLIETRTIRLVKGANSFTLNNLSKLAPGMYFISLATEGNTFFEKIMIQ